MFRYFFCLTCLYFYFSQKAISQTTVCADSSYRIDYLFGTEGATLTNLPDTTGSNFMHGGFIESGRRGIALMKTTWGDSILFAKKIYIDGTSYTAFSAPDGTTFLSGICYINASQTRPLIIKLDINKRVVWAKRYDYSASTNYGAGQPGLLITSDAIYASMYGLAKLDLDGNIIWSKEYQLFSNGIPSLNSWESYIVNDTLYTFGQIYNIRPPGPGSEPFIVLTKINKVTGVINESYAYKTPPHPIIKGITRGYLKLKADKTFSFFGYINTDKTGTGTYTPTFLSLTNLDAGLNPFTNYYFSTDNTSYNMLSSNNWGNKSAFSRYPLDFYTAGYFLNFNNNNKVKRNIKVTIPFDILLPNRETVYQDDKENIHFMNNSRVNNKIFSTYTRISNLSPNISTNCLGKDTSLPATHPFTLIKEPFTWVPLQNNSITVYNVPYTEDTATVTKQLVCKIVSYCDSLKITGPATACENRPIRYAAKRNATCQKFTDWSIDTAFANIVNMEGDSAITLSFKKTFTGYLHAALSDCIIKDSIFITTIAPPKMLPLINRTDSLLCPGKTLTLNTNNGYTNYVWQGSSNGQQFTATTAGKYVVTALDSCSNPVTDSIVVTVSDTSMNITASQTICLYDTAFITLPGDVNNITWQPAANSLLRNKTIVAYPSTTTLYTVTAERQTNCAISHISLVTVKPCPQTFYMPNSFTPNNDGLNDKFKPAISQPLAAYRFTIYNRYGQNIFTTGNQNLGWDGMYQNSKQPMGGYIYYCTYRFNNGTEKTVKGYFMLLR